MRLFDKRGIRRVGAYYGGIGDELVASVKGNVTVDWMHRDTARSRTLLLRNEMDR